jgi:uncharacterized protein
MKALSKSKIFYLIVLLIMTRAAAAQSLSDLAEKPDFWVNDYAGILSGTEQATLNQMLADLERRSSNQIVIAILRQIPHDDYLEDFAAKLYRQWKLGLADQDNGILLVITINDHKVRLETGYGLEDVVTDAQSATLIRDYLAPEFRQGNYYAGIKAVLDVLIPAVEGKYKIPVSGGINEGFTLSPGMIIAIFILFIFLAKVFNTRRSVGYDSKGKKSYYDGPSWWGGGGSSSGGSGGGFGGGGFGGGGFSGGGFSGGFGGSSGGGGASGSW